MRSFLSQRSFPFFLLIFLHLIPVRGGAVEPWEDDFKRFRNPIEIELPGAFRIYASPAAGAAAVAEKTGPVRVLVTGFVEGAGKRFYVTEDSYSRWIDTQTGLVWLSADGGEKIPPLPKYLARKPGIDPDSGEDVVADVYEETYAVQPVTRWPAEPVEKEILDSFPAAVLSIEPGTAGLWTVEFQLFPNADAFPGKYPFFDPSYRELMSGAPTPLVRLVSKPDRPTFRLEMAVPEKDTTIVIAPGMVFLASFREGTLARLSMGTDAWSELSPVSTLSPPVFRSGGNLEFSFVATRIKADPVSIRFQPDRILGADYTKYDLIAAMGAPFDEYSPVEYQSGWTLFLEADLTTKLYAPLYDGRGAPGMLELEGLDLDPAPAETGPPVYSAEDLVAFRSVLSGTLPVIPAQDGWKSILETKLGDVPTSQRGPETEGSDSGDGF
jgi:hypothetical protein